MNEEDLVYRLKKRAEIRRQISDRKSVQEGKPDRIADLLEEAAREIEMLRIRTTLKNKVKSYQANFRIIESAYNGEGWWYRLFLAKNTVTKYKVFVYANDKNGVKDYINKYFGHNYKLGTATITAKIKFDSIVLLD